MDAQLGVGVMHKCNRLSFFLSSFVPFLFSLFFPFSYSADDVWAEFEFQTVKLISQHGQGVSAVLDRVLRFPALPLLHTIRCGVANQSKDLRNTCPAPQL